jgi:hypothetical protein
MLLEVPCLIRRKPTWTTAGAQLQRLVKPEFGPKPDECRERVDDQPITDTDELIVPLRLFERPLEGNSSVPARRFRCHFYMI